MLSTSKHASRGKDESVQDVKVVLARVVAHVHGTPTDRARGGVETVETGALDGVVQGFARYIDSDQPLQAWQFSPASAGNDNDASILLPTQTLGMRHRLASYVSQPFTTPEGGQVAGGAQTLVVHATEDDTTVVVTFTAPRAKAGPVELDGANAIDVEMGMDSAEFVLDRGQSLLLHQPFDDLAEDPLEHDWTGSLVESTAPVAVYAASITMLPYDFAGVPPEQVCCQDTIAAAVPPTEVLGTRYVAVKTVPLGEAEDVFRFVANVDGTTIEVTGDVNETLALDAGEFAEIRSTGAMVIEGNEPFVAVHYLPSASAAHPKDPIGGGPPTDTYDCGEIQLAGDPGMNILFPVDNWLDEYLFVQGAAGVGGGWCNDHATITAALDRWSEITLSDETLPEPTPIGDSNFGYVRVPLPEDTYRLRAPADVGVQLDVYGVRTTGSYLYPGGVRLEAINPEG